MVNLPSYSRCSFDLDSSKFKISPLSIDLSVCNALTKLQVSVIYYGGENHPKILYNSINNPASEEYAGVWPKQLNLLECCTRGTLAALKIKTSQFCHF